MAGMIRRAFRVPIGALLSLGFLAGPIVQAQPQAGAPAQLIGLWRGTSICTDRVAAPACRDETVVYEFTAGSQPGTVHWLADKVVDGERQTMGELDLAYDATEACWNAEFSSPRTRIVWRLKVDGTQLSGTGRQLPGDETVRKVELTKQ
jgi:hypothetical protein